MAAPNRHSLDSSLQVPIVYIHGLNGSAKVFEELQKELDPPCRWPEGDDGPTAGCSRSQAIRYDNLGDITDPALQEELRVAIADMARASPNGKVDLVAHSMGGLLSRYLLAHDPEAADKVRQLIMVATPNHGSWVAYGIRLSDMVDDPRYYGIDQHRMRQEGQRLYNQYIRQFRGPIFSVLMNWKMNPSDMNWGGESI